MTKRTQATVAMTIEWCAGAGAAITIILHPAFSWPWLAGIGASLAVTACASYMMNRVVE